MSHLPPILVVEDSEDQVFLLRHAFQKVGIMNPVHFVSCGEDAIDYLSGAGRYSDWKEFPLPSVVLLDLNLPGLNGLAVLRWIRQQPGLRALRVAMLTSSDLSQEINAAYEAGANVFLTKPVDLGKLIDMMRGFRSHWLEIAQAPQISRPVQKSGEASSPRQSRAITGSAPQRPGISQSVGTFVGMRR
jgi:CheY-like chemotaxis protein